MGGTLIQEVFVAQDVLEIMKIPLLRVTYSKVHT